MSRNPFHLPRLLCAAAAVLWLACFGAGCAKPKSATRAAADSAHQEGGWVGTGGNLYEDGNNPWFVENTTAVRYCIAFDPKGVSVAEDVAGELIEKALAYWKGQFKFPNSYDLGPVSIKVGTQSFTRSKACDGSEDLKFNLGWETLDSEQQRFLNAQKIKPAQVIATSVRTDYDRVNLKGRGFIFVNSDRGAHAYETGGRLIEGAWQHQALLFRALVHELGHVFGLPHLGHGIMETRAMEDALDKQNYKDWLEIGFNIGSIFFSIEAVTKDCSRSDEQRKWFGLAPEQKCLYFQYNGDETATISASSSPASADKAVIGKLVGDTAQKGSEESAFETGIQLWLPAEQKAYPEERTKGRRYMRGPGFMTLADPVKFIPNGASAGKAAYLRLSPNQQQIVGEQDGKMIILYQNTDGDRLHISH